MIYLPWCPASMVITITLTSIAIVCYFVVLYYVARVKYMRDLAALIVSLIMSQVFYILYIVFGYLATTR